MDQTARWRKDILTRLLVNHTECFRWEHSDSQKGAALLLSSCRCTDGDSILPSHVGGGSLKHEKEGGQKTWKFEF